MLRTGQALAAGISKPVFYQFVQSRGLEQAADVYKRQLHNYAKAQEEAARAGDKEPPKKKDRNTEEEMCIRDRAQDQGPRQPG